MGVIRLHGCVDTNEHLFEKLVEQALDLLQKMPGYEYAIFECDGVTVPVYRGASMEEILSDYQSRRLEFLGVRLGQVSRR